MGSSSIQGHPCQGVIDRNGQLSGSVMKCLHLSGFGRERGYGRLNPPAIDSSSSKRCISEEKLCLPSPEGSNRAAGNCLCSLGEHQPGEQLRCLPAPRSQQDWWEPPEQPSRALKGLGDQRGNSPRLLLQPSVRLVRIWLCRAKTH